MTTVEAVAIFKILQDKYASPHLIDSEIVRMLNMAQYERLNRLVPDDMGGVANFEQDQNIALNLKPLIYRLTDLTLLGGSPPACILLDNDINGKLADVLQDLGLDEPTAKYFRVYNLAETGDSTKYVKYVKHNNIQRISQNSFKAPGTDSLCYTTAARGFQLYPTVAATVAKTFEITVIKHPRKLALETTFDAAVDPEWDDYNMNLIIMIALQLAGISTRDEELIADIRNTKITN